MPNDPRGRASLVPDINHVSAVLCSAQHVALSSPGKSRMMAAHRLFWTTMHAALCSRQHVALPSSGKPHDGLEVHPSAAQHVLWRLRGRSSMHATIFFCDAKRKE
jgi:hypothetical protein